jgi:predicted NAD-dependent protein-ADP-ribosyltransferase YbiA (DUF1768 family)
VEFYVDGILYYSAENYFQCQKSVGVSAEDFENTRKRFLCLMVQGFHILIQAIHFLSCISGHGMSVWSAGSRVQIRPDWEIIKVRVMYTGNRAKFEQHPELARSLVSTGNAKISFQDSSSFWCAVNAFFAQAIRSHLSPTGVAGMPKS